MSSGEVLSNGTTMLITRTPTPRTPATTAFPRAASPALDLFPLRRGSTQDVQIVHRGMKLAKDTERSVETRSRSNSKATDKGKEPIRGSHTDNVANFGRETYVSAYNGVSPYSSHDKIRPTTADSALNGRSKFRGSLLVAASDALGLRFGRRRPQSVRQPPTPRFLPEVIEISARRDKEDEERNRLRQMAAEAIGLAPFLVTREDSTTDEDDEEQPPVSESRSAYPSNSDSVPNVEARSLEGSSLSVSVIPQQPPTSGRYRSNSVVQPTSETISPIPPFPSTVSVITSFKNCDGVFPKYYPPSSLRIFALSKNWKSRYLILSSPVTPVARGQSPVVSYLHLFKTSGREEKELERLEINEDSVVFVSEEEVGGKRHVIKVGGADVGAMKKEYTHEEGGHTMWLLQIPDQIVAQKWITDIKKAILGQRTVRAGLIPAHTLGNNEPQGDMDVMLTIRAQNLVTSPNPHPRASQTISPINTSFTDSKGTYASSVSSQSVRSQQSTVPKSPTNGAVSTLKGLFSNSRPRSTSRAASIESERQAGQAEREGYEESFTSMGSNLLNMLRSNTPDTQSTNTTVNTPLTRLPFSGPVNPINRRIDRKIISEHTPIQWASVEPTPSTSIPINRTARGFSIGAMSLQPPPRKRWTSTTSSNMNQDPVAEASGNDRSRRTSLTQSVVSTERAETEPPSSPGHLSAFQFGTPEQRPRAPSLQSVSTYASAENAVSIERSSLSTKRSSGTRSARRWSRQGVLPTRLNPPSDPPPAIPTMQSPAASSVSERATTPNSAQSSDKSVVSNLPTFNKRASGSSVRSFGSYKTSHSNTGSGSATPNFNSATITVRGPSHRVSMPPPRPAPTSALPPAPVPVENTQDVLKPLEIVSSSKSSFRTSVAHRGFRLSTIAAPKPPPSTTLPPRPDETEYQTRRRSSSGGSSINIIHTHSPQLETIPASPIPPAKIINPFPPPDGPLPPTPPVPATLTTPTQPKRTTSIKERLRKISAHSTSGNQQGLRPHFTRPPSMSVSTGSPMLSTSPPPTPIAEKITLFQNDPSFLQMHTPIIPSITPQAFLSLPAEDEENDGITSLSPPPRRGSKQLLETEMESFKSPVPVETEDKKPSTDVPRHLSLSRPGSIYSHHSHHSQEVLDADWESPRDETSPEQLPFEEKLPSPAEPRHMSLSRPGSVISLTT